MRLLGDFAIEGEHVYVVQDNRLCKPYLFIHQRLGVFNNDRPVTLIPGISTQTHIVNTLTPTAHEDDLLIWFYAASHTRMRVQRHLSRNVMILNSGEWGSTVIAIAHKDSKAELVFTKSDQVETATLEQGVVLRSMGVHEHRHHHSADAR